MEIDSQDIHVAYEHIDELIKSFNRLLVLSQLSRGVSKVLSGLLRTRKFAGRSFDQNIQQARNLIAVSEEAIRQKNRVIDGVTRFYRANSALKYLIGDERIWERMIVRFNNSLALADRDFLDSRILTQENALDQLFNCIASENILSTKNLFREIYHLELQLRDRQTRTRVCINSLKSAAAEHSNSHTEYFMNVKQMRKINDLALVAESTEETLDRLELLNMDYSSNLERNM